MSTTKVSYFVVLICYVDSEAYFGVFQHIKAGNYAKVRLFKSTLNTPNQNTLYLKIRLRTTKLRLAKSKICSYLVANAQHVLPFSGFQILHSNMHQPSEQASLAQSVARQLKTEFKSRPGQISLNTKSLHIMEFQ